VEVDFKMKIILRRHILTLMPDILLFFASLLFLLEMRALPAQTAFSLKGICEGAAIFFMAIGLLDVVKWRGFRVVVTSRCIEVHRFWIYRNVYCLDERGLSVNLIQDGWDEKLDKGSLVIYEPGGEVVTLDDLGDFSRLVDWSPLMSS
jgi:hypothetical protein